MKKLLILLAFFPFALSGQVVNIGSSANDGTGDNLRTAFGKINTEFALKLAKTDTTAMLLKYARKASPTFTGTVTLPTTTSIGNVSSAEVGYLDNVTSAIQTQINGKEASLGNPASDGYILSSTAAGVRSWVAGGEGGSMIYPASGIAVSSGAGWGTSVVNNSTNWNTAYNHSQAAHQTIVNGTGFVKATGTTLSYDNSSYSLTSHNHTGTYEAANSNIQTHISTTHQTVINGTGFVKATGTSLSYDNNTYATTAQATSAAQTVVADSLAARLSGATSAVALADSNIYGGYVTRTFLNANSVNDSELTDSLNVLRTQIANLIVTMNSSGMLVTSINVASLSGAITIATDGGTLDFAADVEPNTAVDTTLTWSYIAGTGTATFETEDGAPTLTAVTNGTVTVRATSNDGSNVYGEREITLSNQVDAVTDNFEAYSVAALAGQGNWIAGLNTISVVDVAGNKKINPNTSEDHCAAVYNQTFANNQYAQIARGTETSGYIGVGVRLSGSGATLNGYTLSSNATTCTLGKYTNGVWSLLAEGAQAVTTNDVLKLTVVGNELSCYLNGSLITAISTDGKVTDTSYTTGKVGITGYGSWAQRADSWEGGSL